VPFLLNGLAKIGKKKFQINSAIRTSFPNHSENKLLEIAKQRISQFTFVGITEKFEESLQLLYYTLGWWPIRQEYPKLNVAKKRIQLKELPKETINALNDCTNLDRELYRFAKKIFEDRHSKAIKDLKEQYQKKFSKSLLKKDSIYDLLEKHYDYDCGGSQIPLVSSYRVNFRKPIIGSGWQDREIVGKTCYRWTGPTTTSTIYLPLEKNRDLKLKIRIRAITEDILSSFKIEVNANFIQIKNLNKNKQTNIIEGIIPRSMLQVENSLSCITFHVNRTTTPFDVNPSQQDKREVGLLFSDLVVSPIAN